MASGLLGKKIGMTRIFEEDGRIVPVTVIELGPCVVMDLKTVERDGYESIQLGFDDRKRQSANQPAIGLAKKAQTEPKKFIREVEKGEGEYKQGQVLTVKDVFEGVEAVDIIGQSKGRGFAGCIKRHNFQSGPRSHGSKNIREPGSTGPLGPSRSLKNAKLPGHMGAARVTQRNLKVVEIDQEHNYMLVRGSIPGHRQGYVIVRKTNKV